MNYETYVPDESYSEERSLTYPSRIDFHISVEFSLIRRIFPELSPFEHKLSAVRVSHAIQM